MHRKTFISFCIGCLLTCGYAQDLLQMHEYKIEKLKNSESFNFVETYYGRKVKEGHLTRKLSLDSLNWYINNWHERLSGMMEIKEFCFAVTNKVEFISNGIFLDTFIFYNNKQEVSNVMVFKNNEMVFCDLGRLTGGFHINYSKIEDEIKVNYKGFRDVWCFRKNNVKTELDSISFPVYNIYDELLDNGYWSGRYYRKLNDSVSEYRNQLDVKSRLYYSKHSGFWKAIKLKRKWRLVRVYNFIGVGESMLVAEFNSEKSMESFFNNGNCKNWLNALDDMDIPSKPFSYNRVNKTIKNCASRLLIMEDSILILDSNLMSDTFKIVWSASGLESSIWSVSSITPYMLTFDFFDTIHVGRLPREIWMLEKNGKFGLFNDCGDWIVPCEKEDIAVVIKRTGNTDHAGFAFLERDTFTFAFNINELKGTMKNLYDTYGYCVVEGIGKKLKYRIDKNKIEQKGLLRSGYTIIEKFGDFIFFE